MLPLQRNEIVSESRIAQHHRAGAPVGSRAKKSGRGAAGASLFADLEKTTCATSERSKRHVEFYTHEEAWKNKLICGDSLHVMESLLHYENLRGKVQMIYIDPPYGVKLQYELSAASRYHDRTRAKDRCRRCAHGQGVPRYLGDWACIRICPISSERLYLMPRVALADTRIACSYKSATQNFHLRSRRMMDEVFGADRTSVALNRILQDHQSAPRGKLLPSVGDFLLVV